MAEYRVLYWRDIPSMVVAGGQGREVQERLPQRYQDAIDEVAMEEGATDGEAYLEGWRWGATERREGSPEEVLRAVLQELMRAYPLAAAGDAFAESL